MKGELKSLEGKGVYILKGIVRTYDGKRKKGATAPKTGGNVVSKNHRRAEDRNVIRGRDKGKSGE